MGVGLLFGSIFLLLLFSVGVVCVVRSIRKKSKIGLVFSSLLVIFVISVLFINKIDQVTFSKDDAKADLKNLNIDLKNEFKIVSNRVSGMPERYQETTVEINEKDKSRIIQEIVESKNYLHFTNRDNYLQDTRTGNFKLDDSIYNFSYSGIYLRETYSRIEGYPTIIFLKVYDTTNTIKYSIIEN